MEILLLFFRILKLTINKRHYLMIYKSEMHKQDMNLVEEVKGNHGVTNKKNQNRCLILVSSLGSTYDMTLVRPTTAIREKRSSLVWYGLAIADILDYERVCNQI